MEDRTLEKLILDRLEKSENLLLAKFEKSDEIKTNLQRQVSDVSAQLATMIAVRDLRLKDFEYLVHVVRDDENSIITRLKLIEDRIDDIEEDRQEGRDNTVWIKTSFVAIVAGSIGALWEMIKHFWIK